MINLQEIRIEKALEQDSEALTIISFAAKRHWNYPTHFYDIWKDELTITGEYILQNTIYKAIYKNLIIGFYSIVENKSEFYSGGTFVQKGFWLEHIFIHPDYHGIGIGRKLIENLKQISLEKRIHNLLIFVDPFARGFYDKVGADYLYDTKSSIPDRLIPVYKLKI